MAPAKKIYPVGSPPCTETAAMHVAAKLTIYDENIAYILRLLSEAGLFAFSIAFDKMRFRLSLLKEVFFFEV